MYVNISYQKVYMNLLIANEQLLHLELNQRKANWKKKILSMSLYCNVTRVIKFI